MVEQGGAGEGNRTLTVSMGSLCSTIELRPHLSVVALPVCRISFEAS